MRMRRGETETNYAVRSFDVPIGISEYSRLPKNPLYIVLDNLRSAFNVGSIFRLCDAMRVEGLLLCGYTAFPPHIKLAKTSLGTIDYVPWRRFESSLDAVAWLHERNIPVWAAETCDTAARYDTVRWPQRVAIVLGNEALGLDTAVLEECDRIIEIPLCGFKNSINVATACSVLGFKFIEKRGIATQTALRRLGEEPSGKDES